MFRFVKKGSAGAAGIATGRRPPEQNEVCLHPILKVNCFVYLLSLTVTNDTTVPSQKLV